MEIKSQTIDCDTHLKSIEQPSLASCIACQGSLSFLGKKLNYFYSTCDACKTVQLSPLPGKAELEKAYSDSLYAANIHGQGDPTSIHESSRPYYMCIADALSDHNVSGLVVDYGAGWGGLCSVLLKRGFECKGIELAKNMVEGCQRMQLPVQQGSLESLREDGCKAQAIVLCGVFEHLVDPRKFFEDAHAILDPNGFLISLQPTAPFASLFAFISRLGQKRSFLLNIPALIF
jgi:SAM-dependent methyltransferase